MQEDDPSAGLPNPAGSPKTRRHSLPGPVGRAGCVSVVRAIRWLEDHEVIDAHDDDVLGHHLPGREGRIHALQDVA